MTPATLDTQATIRLLLSDTPLPPEVCKQLLAWVRGELSRRRGAPKKKRAILYPPRWRLSAATPPIDREELHHVLKRGFQPSPELRRQLAYHLMGVLPAKAGRWRRRDPYIKRRSIALKEINELAKSDPKQEDAFVRDWGMSVKSLRVLISRGFNPKQHK